jgi:enamine deaminase RidA (YjgF/YER057c/UK114 family)
MSKVSQQPGEPEEISKKAVAETVSAAIAEWLEHLRTCVEAEGSNFECQYYK